jgi:hypothetical protein
MTLRQKKPRFSLKGKNVENFQMDGICSTHGGDEKWRQKFKSKNVNKRMFVE